MMNDTERIEQQLSRLERKVDTLQWFVGAQTVIMATAGSLYLVYSLPKFLFWLIVLAIAISLIVPGAPGWAARSGRQLVNFIRTQWRASQPRW